MRRILSLVLVALILAVVLYRDRLFVRDPLGNVERNGVTVSDARVFINYSNDVLLQERNDTHMVLLQQWNPAPVTPSGLTCIQGIACVTPADRIVNAETPRESSPADRTEMSNREVTFTDTDGSRVHVTLR